jgi:hypothetical protein
VSERDEKGGWETIAIFHDGSLCRVWREKEAEAWKVARRWVRAGIDESRERGLIFSPSFIREVRVREYDPENWKTRPKAAEPLIEMPAEPRIVIP